MLTDSNFYILQHYRLKPSQREQRVKALHDTLDQLEKYHAKAPKNKRHIVERLILAYDELLYKLTS